MTFGPVTGLAIVAGAFAAAIGISVKEAAPPEPSASATRSPVTCSHVEVFDMDTLPVIGDCRDGSGRPVPVNLSPPL
jgi:hypothetical protein